MMSAKEAIYNLNKLSGKIGGLSLHECRVFDESLRVIDSYLLQEEKKSLPQNVTPIKAPDPQL